jgi:uncharacterized membrane protein YccC
MSLGLGFVLVAIFVLAFVMTGNLREAFNETIWFGAGWMAALAVIYLFDSMGYGYISTSPAGLGGGIGLVVGFVALFLRRRMWRKEQARKRLEREAERARRRAAGEPDPGPLGNVVRSIRKSRASNGQ